MQKNYLVVGGVAILLLGSLLFFGSSNKLNKSGVENNLTPVSSFSHSHGIAVDVADPQKIYIATHEGLYLLSRDRDLYQIGKTQDDLMGFNSHPTEAGVFFSSGHPSEGGNIGLQKTTDGGITWKRVSDGLGGRVDFHAMTVSYANPNIIYGFFGDKLQRSVDGGRSWEYAKGIIAPFSLSSDPKNEDVVFASTQNGVQVSKDGGDTWQSMSPQLEGGAVSIFVLDPTSAYALVFSEKLSGMGKSIDGGVTWEKMQETFGDGMVLYVAFSKSQPGLVYSLTNKNSVYKSTDSGDTWVRVR